MTDAYTDMEFIHTLKKSRLDQQVDLPITTIDDVKSPTSSQASSSPPSLFSHVSRLRDWDSRTFFTQWWNYAIYDKQTRFNINIMYLLQRYPDWMNKAPETMLTIGAFDGHGRLIFSTSHVVPSYNVQFINDADMYYNATTIRYPQQQQSSHHHDIQESFSHVMDNTQQTIDLRADLDISYPCGVFHVDHLKQDDDEYGQLIERISSFLTNSSDNTHATSHSTTGYYQSDILDPSSTASLTGSVFELSSSKVVPTDGTRTCISHLSMDYTIYSLDGAFVNDDINAVTDHDISYQEFIEKFKQYHIDKSLPPPPRVFETDDEALKACRNGHSILYGYNSAPSGYSRLTPSTHAKYEKDLPPTQENKSNIDRPTPVFPSVAHCGSLDSTTCPSQGNTDNNHRYLLFKDLTLTTLTADSIVFWAFPPQAPLGMEFLKQHLVENGSSTNTTTDDHDWHLVKYINRFRTYAAGSCGCSITRGNPSHENPWSWIWLSHTLDKRYDHVYVHGVPASLAPDGRITPTSIPTTAAAAAAQKNQDSAQSIEEYLRNIIDQTAQKQSYSSDAATVTRKISSTGQVASSLVVNDVSMVTGDARLDNNDGIGPMYGTYSYTKLPSEQMLASRLAILRENHVIMPPHPHSISDINERNAFLSYYNKHHHQTEASQSFYHTQQQSSVENNDHYRHQPLPHGITAAHDAWEHHHLTNRWQPRRYINNIPFFSGSNDGHLARFNVTKHQWYEHHDIFGNSYIPSGQTFVIETRTKYVFAHALTATQEQQEHAQQHLQKGTTPDTSDALKHSIFNQGFTFRATFTMWTDVGKDREEALVADKRTILHDLQQYHHDISVFYNQTTDELMVSKSNELFLLSSDDFQQMQHVLEHQQGDLSLYSDFRTVSPHVTMFIYDKSYIRGSCQQWYTTIGHHLDHIESHNGATNAYANTTRDTNKNTNKKKTTQKNNTAKVCSRPGDWNHSIWCAQYDTTLPSFAPVDPLDTVAYHATTQHNQQQQQQQQQQQEGTCVVYSKRLYIPRVDAAMTEHAYQSAIRMDIPTLLHEPGQTNKASALFTRMEIMMKQMKAFYQQHPEYIQLSQQQQQQQSLENQQKPASGGVLYAEASPIYGDLPSQIPIHHPNQQHTSPLDSILPHHQLPSSTTDITASPAQKLLLEHRTLTSDEERMVLDGYQQQWHALIPSSPLLQNDQMDTTRMKEYIHHLTTVYTQAQDNSEIAHWQQLTTTLLPQYMQELLQLSATKRQELSMKKTQLQQLDAGNESLDDKINLQHALTTLQTEVDNIHEYLSIIRSKQALYQQLLSQYQVFLPQLQSRMESAETQYQLLLNTNTTSKELYNHQVETIEKEQERLQQHVNDLQAKNAAIIANTLAQRSQEEQQEKERVERLYQLHQKEKDSVRARIQDSAFKHPERYANVDLDKLANEGVMEFGQPSQ